MQTHISHQLLQHLKKHWDSNWKDCISHINDFICYYTQKHMFLQFQKEALVLIVGEREC